jgi:uncharacterized protein
VQLGLWHSGRLIAPAEIAETRSARRKGLLGRGSLDGVFVLTPCRAVHTVRMRFPIDVAHLTPDNTVLRITTMRPGRIGRPVFRAHTVLEAAAGSFVRWDVAVNDQLELR